jgi:hypothetical protein
MIHVMNEWDRLVLRADDEYDAKVVKRFEKPVNWGYLSFV